MNLRQAAFSGGRWTATSLMGRGMVQLAQTMVLARLLAPADFGLMAIVGGLCAIVSLFVDLGLSSALIHFPEPSPVARSTLYWLNLAAAGLTMFVFMALGWPLAAAYGQPALLPLIVGMSLSMPLAALGHQFCVMAEKELRFSTLSLIELVAAFCGFAAAVGVAYWGGGVWAFVASSLTATVTSSALAWLLLSQGIRPAFRFDLPAVKPYLRYGSYRLGDAALSSVQSQADVLIGGAVLGSAAMGVYTVPRNLSLQVAYGVINPVVTRVGLPVMAKLQDNLAALKTVYLQTLRMTASMNFPIYAALAVWAEEVVAIVLGERWTQAGDFMRLFALWGLVRSTANPVGSLLYATGRVRAAFWWNLVLALVVPGILWFGAAFAGALGLAASMLGVQLLLFYPLFRWLVRPACGLRFGEYAGVLLPPLAASACAVAAGYAVASCFPQNVWIHIVLGGTTAAIVYLGTSSLVNRSWLQAMVEFLQPILRRGT